jgi:hypothetical protein
MSKLYQNNYCLSVALWFQSNNIILANLRIRFYYSNNFINVLKHYVLSLVKRGPLKTNEET